MQGPKRPNIHVNFCDGMVCDCRMKEDMWLFISASVCKFSGFTGLKWLKCILIQLFIVLMTNWAEFDKPIFSRCIFVLR